MAIYSELPVYKASYDLLQKIFAFVGELKREYKFTVGEKLKNETLEMIMCIYRANVKNEKEPVIQKAREHVEVVRLLVRLLKDMKQIGLRQFVDTTKQIEEVSKQLTGWQRSVK